MAYNLAQKILNDDKTVITNMSSVLSSINTLSICNIHTADISVDLYAASQVSTDITTTGVQAAEAEAISTSSVVLNVDQVVPTDDMLKDEIVYKSDGTIFGTATATADATPDTVTFGDGLTTAIANDDFLFTGTRYYILKGTVVPANTTLVLEQNELRVDPSAYTMYIKSSNASGKLDIITRK
tara:strand:+ start:48 stop:596 length:549 start_codon:yes stop_codon:yes gene_type:complete